MKKSIKILIISMLTIILFEINSNAASLNLSTNLDEVNSGEEVEIKIKAKDNMQTTTFYLQYDNNQLEFLNNKIEGMQTKDYPEEGVLKVVYLDLTSNGSAEFTFKFKVKQNISDTIKVKVTNLAVNFIDDDTLYTESNLDNSVLETSINIKDELVLGPGIKYAFIVVGVLLILLIIVNIMHGRDKKRKK